MIVLKGVPRVNQQRLRSLFLQAAYKLAQDNNMGWVSIDQLQSELGMEPENPAFLNDEVLKVAYYFGEKGLLKRQVAGWGMFTLTAEGTDQAEREIQEARKRDLQDFLNALYKLSDGNPAELVQWDDIASEMGWVADNQRHHEYSLAIAERLRQSGYVTIEVEEGDLYRITARGLDQVEGKAQYIAATPIQPVPDPPPAISESLSQFRVDHTNADKTAFIMMQFRDTNQHTAISEAIKNSLGKHGISGVRADDKEYHDDLFPNVLTYMHGSGFGIAVFERIEEEAFNPNVSLEIGYMLALGKPVCFLKDRTLKSLNADLIGRLYREFDSYEPDSSIPPKLDKWLEDRNLV